MTIFHSLSREKYGHAPFTSKHIDRATGGRHELLQVKFCLGVTKKTVHYETSEVRQQVA